MTDRDEALREATDLAAALDRIVETYHLPGGSERKVSAAATKIRELVSALASPRLPWVACEERLPETEKFVWWLVGGGLLVRKGTWMQSAWKCRDRGITHWLPLESFDLPTPEEGEG